MIVLIGKYYLSGYYFSKEKCLEQLKNTLYLQDNIVLEEVATYKNIEINPGNNININTNNN